MSVTDTQTAASNPPFSAETYYATQPPPPTLEEDVTRVRQFITRQREANRKVVLVTVSPSVSRRFRACLCHPHTDQQPMSFQSGGTTVPLELNV